MDGWMDEVDPTCSIAGSDKTDWRCGEHRDFEAVVPEASTAAAAAAGTKLVCQSYASSLPAHTHTHTHTRTHERMRTYIV